MAPGRLSGSVPGIEPDGFVPVIQTYKYQSSEKASGIRMRLKSKSSGGNRYGYRRS